MSDETIRVGDMARLVWACCAKGRLHIGDIVTVKSITEDAQSWCPMCNFRTTSAIVCGDWTSGHRDGFAPRAWVIKIQPPSQPETTEREEELTI